MKKNKKRDIILIIIFLGFILLALFLRFPKPYASQKNDAMKQASHEMNEIRNALNERGFIESDYYSSQSTDALYQATYHATKDGQDYDFHYSLYLSDLSTQMNYSITVESESLNIKEPLCIQTNTNRMGQLLGIENAYQKIENGYTQLKKEQGNYRYESDELEILIHQENQKYIYEYTLKK